MAMPKILIGCDPELFLRDKEGKAVSAWGKIPGDKANPHPVKGGAIQVDGNAVEFNIEPASSLQQWNDNIASVMDALKSAIPGDTKLCIEPTIDFDPDYFASLPEGARELGCNPDWSAYTEKENPRPDGNPPFRTASGHIHIGWTEGKDPNDPDHRADCIEVIKQLDFYLGAPALSWDKDSRRRLMYGKAGACRFKSYGVEYRTPSNMWLSDPISQSYVYDATMAAVSDLFEGRAMRVGYGDNWAQSYIEGKASRWCRDAAHAIQNGSKTLQKIGLLNMYDYFYKKQQRETVTVGLKASDLVNVKAKKIAFDIEAGGVNRFQRADVDRWANGDVAIAPRPRARPVEDHAARHAAIAAQHGIQFDEHGVPLWRGMPMMAHPDRELVRARDWAMAIPWNGENRHPARLLYNAAGEEQERRRAAPNMNPEVVRVR